jgi:predicted short-subunit dehydrogenase-like oxidoreductase (DUF2520 family)
LNRQVPNRKYTIIGDGRVARHFKHYFNLVGITYNHWQRSQSNEQLQLSIAQSDCVLILIADDAIETFISRHTFLIDKNLIHFSGTLNIDNAIGCHPLMTFSHELYDIHTYQSIPFVCDEHVQFNELFPQLKNNSFNLNKDKKAYYHAMCVMAGNFSQILMRESSKKINSELNLPADILFPYLLQNTKNFISHPENSATGPLERGDFSTISKHLQVLQGDELKSIYKSFIKHSYILSESLESKNTESKFNKSINPSLKQTDHSLPSNQKGVAQ